VDLWTLTFDLHAQGPGTFDLLVACLLVALCLFWFLSCDRVVDLGPLPLFFVLVCGMAATVPSEVT
jgi:F0F1-type ATP synthase assembly protein I